MEITRLSLLSGKTHTLDLPVTEEQMDRFDRREELLKDIFVDLSPSEREFINSGSTPEEWITAFGLYRGMTHVESLAAVIDDYENAIDVHIYDEGEEPDSAPERLLVSAARAALKALQNPTIVVYVDGGNVQSIYCSVGACVDVVDFDNMQDEDYAGGPNGPGALSEDECENELATAVEGLVHVY